MKKLLVVIIISVAVLFALPEGIGVILSFASAKGGIEGYKELLFNCFPFYRMFWNSVLYSVLITLGEIIISVLFAFGYSQLEFKGKSLVYIGYIILMLMPLQVTILPNYIGLRDMGLLYQPLGIVLPLIFSPFGIVVMNQYMTGSDGSIVEAARLETTSVLTVAWYQIVPQMKVCICAVLLYVFADCWNILEQPMLFLKEDQYRTLSYFLTAKNTYDPSVFLPAAVIYVIPVALLNGFFSEYLEEGLSLGEIKL